ncbi:MAG: NAD(P)-dependent alcohol dehydrogenase [Alphaproteobacteria bacterium]|nr:NAD(P)-dependent alcohol dehydrogenase [Alphaproteobacteria bacterium]
MRAIIQTAYGAPEQVLTLAEVEPPTPARGEVLIRTRATTVNTPDWVTVTGTPWALRLRFGLTRPPSPIRGADIAGVVEAVGAGVTDLQPFDAVFGSAWTNTLATPGTYCELAVARDIQLIRKPDALSFEEAASAVTSGLTAMIGLYQVAKVQPGQRVLINGASGGVGTFAVQMAKAMGGHVTAVCSARNEVLVRSLGADAVIDYNREDFTQGDARYDVILDNVMNHPPGRTARALAPGGLFMPNSVGNSGGWFAGLPRMARAWAMGLTGTRVGFITCVLSRENLTALAELLVSGGIRVVIDRTVPLEQAAEAVAYMLTHRARGQIAISVG